MVFFKSLRCNFSCILFIFEVDSSYTCYVVWKNQIMKVSKITSLLISLEINWNRLINVFGDVKFYTLTKSWSVFNLLQNSKMYLSLCPAGEIMFFTFKSTIFIAFNCSLFLSFFSPCSHADNSIVETRHTRLHHLFGFREST